VDGAERGVKHWKLRCRFRARGRHGCRRKFAVGPDRAVFEIFFLPDRYDALKGINRKAAGVKSGGPVRGADGDKHAGFADFEAAKAVDDGDPMNAVLLAELSRDLTHFAKGHRFVSFVVEVKRWAIMGLIAHEAIKGDYGSVLGSANVADERFRINRLADQSENIVVIERRRHGWSLAAADRRQKGDFVA